MEFIHKYKKLILKDPNYDELYKWEAMKIFQQRWGIDDPDFLKMYDESLQKASNLWAGRYQNPKNEMMKYIGNDPKAIRDLFNMLFDESIDIKDRLDQFNVGVNNAFKKYYDDKTQNLNHFHDLTIISKYLTFRYPDKYTFYK